MFKSKQDDENNRVQVDRDFKSQHQRRSALEVHRHLQPRQLILQNLQLITFGQEVMRLQRVTTTTTAPRVQTTMHQVNRRIYHAQTAVQRRLQSGVEIFAVKWFAMHVDCTLNCTVLIDRIQCVVTRFTQEDVVQRAISRTEEVSCFKFRGGKLILIF